MVQRRGPRLTAAQKAELWRRWREGESLNAIGRVPHGDAVGGPLYGSVCEQPRGSLPPTDATTGASDAALQVGRPSAARDASPSTAHTGLRRMGGGDVCLLTEGRVSSLEEKRARFRSS